MSSRTFGALKFLSHLPAWMMTEVEPHVAIRLKQIFPKIPATSQPPYYWGDDDQNCADLQWFVGRYPMRMAAADAARLANGFEKYQLAQNELARIMDVDYRPPVLSGLRPGKQLRLYQAQAVEVLRHAKGLIVGDEMGLGKTVTAIGACLIPGALPAAIVVLPHLQRQWHRAVQEFTTLRVHSITGTKPYRIPSSDVVIFRYSQMAGWCDYFRQAKFPLAVFDEVQELRTGLESAKGQGAMELCKYATWRVGLSGTPIHNYGDEAWQLFEFLRPGMLGKWPEFQLEWCIGKKLAKPKAFGAYLREQSAFIRRTKADVGQQMPKVNRIVEYVDYDEEAVRSVDDMAHKLAIRATMGIAAERGNAMQQLDLLVRMQTGIAKAVNVARFVRLLVEAGEPVLLGGWHREVYDRWIKELADLKPLLYTGSETPAQKDRNLRAFINGDTDILIMSLRSGAGAEGLQHRCSTAVAGELDWSPAVHDQFIGRLDRDGQTKPVTAFFLVANDGSDPPIMDMLAVKASQSAGITDPFAGPATVHSDDSRLKALVDRYLSVKQGGKRAARG